MKLNWKPLLEVLVVFVVFNVLKPVGRLLFATGLPQKEMEVLGWSYSGAVFLFLIPFVILWLARRDFSAYGLHLKNWRAELDTGMTGYLVSLLPWGIALGIFFLWGLHYSDWLGAALISLAYLAAIWLMLWVMAKRPPRADAKTARGNLILLGCLLALPILVSLWRGSFQLKVVSTVVWQFIFSGFGEEVYWRGYIQSRLNHGFGKPFTMMGVQFGPGLLLASLLFGITHVLNTYNPSLGQYDLSWSWGLMTFFSGLFLGIVREKTGSIFAPGIIHGAPDAVGEALNIALQIGY